MWNKIGTGLIVVLVIACAVLFAISLSLKHDWKQTCIRGGYAGLQYMDGLQEYYCYGVIDGAVVVVDKDDVLARLETK